MDGNIASPLERTEKISAHAEGVVHHHADSLLLCHLHDRLIVRNIECRISDVFKEDGLGAAVYESLKVRYMVALCKTNLDAHVAEGDGEHGECASIEEWLCHDVVSRAADVGYRKEYSRLA